MRQAELDAPDEDPEAKRTMGRYVDRNEGQKMGKITKKKWHIIDPRTSKIVPYWDGVGMVRARAARPCAPAASNARSTRRGHGAAEALGWRTLAR